MFGDYSLKAVFGADVGPLKAGAAEAQGVVGKFSNAVKGISLGFGAAAVLAFFKTVADKAGAVQDLSDRLDVGTDTLQAFNYAVTQAGGSTEDAAKMFTTARKSLDELRAGNDSAEKSFGALGLKAKDFVGLNLEQSVEKIAKAYVAAGNQAGAYAATTDILGQKSAKLDAVVRSLGEQGLPGLVDSARRAGQIIGGDTITNLDKLSDNLATLSGAAVTVGAVVLDVFNTIAKIIGGTVAIIVTLIERMPKFSEFFTSPIEANKKALSAFASTYRDTIGALNDGATEAKKPIDRLTGAIDGATDAAVGLNDEFAGPGVRSMRAYADAASDAADELVRLRNGGSLTHGGPNGDPTAPNATLFGPNGVGVDITPKKPPVLNWKTGTDEGQIVLTSEEQAKLDAQNANTAAYNSMAWGKYRGGELGGTPEMGRFSDAVLKEIIRRTTEQIRTLEDSKLGANLASQVSGNYATATKQGQLSIERWAAQRVLNERESLRRAPNYEAALRGFAGDPKAFDSLYREATGTATKIETTNKFLSSIDQTLRGKFRNA